MKLKVMEPQDFLHWEKDITMLDCLVEIEPVFHRDGTYLDRETGKCWCEEKGRAFEYDKPMFFYELSMLNAKEMTNEEVEGITKICKTKYATKEHRELYYRHRDMMGLRKSKREVELWNLKWRK
jgi:hypothetical protein